MSMSWHYNHRGFLFEQKINGARVCFLLYTHLPQLPSEDCRGSDSVPTAGLLPSASADSLAALVSSVLDQLGGMQEKSILIVRMKTSIIRNIFIFYF